jgi:hypothetical protein
MKKPFSIYALYFLHGFLGINALAGGFLLMIAPDGSLLHMDAGWLENSPFGNYFIPGLLLFIFNGILPVLVLSGLVAGRQWKRIASLNIYRQFYWAWAYSLYAGICAIAWILVQQAMTHYFWLQTVIGAIGLLIIIFTLLPQTMDYLLKCCVEDDVKKLHKRFGRLSTEMTS